MFRTFALSSLFVFASCLSAQAQTWTPVGAGGKQHTLLVTQPSIFPIPVSIALRGGTVLATLVGGGEGGNASTSGCTDDAIQGGKGGDGGEVVDVAINLTPGQCSVGLTIVPGSGGRGGWRGGNASATGEPGGPTTISCGSTALAVAMGGGIRPNAFTSPKAAKGGTGAAVMNVLESQAAVLTERSLSLVRAEDGTLGLHGYGSGGGGGGVVVQNEATVAHANGTSARSAVLRYAPFGRGAYGAGCGAGPAGFATSSALYAAEGASQYGAGGGGGAAVCAGILGPDAGPGLQGAVKLRWQE